jgi:hypothetical protein
MNYERVTIESAYNLVVAGAWNIEEFTDWANRREEDAWSNGMDSGAEAERNYREQCELDSERRQSFLDNGYI